MKTSLSLVICALAAACAPTDDADPPALGQTGMNLQFDVLADTDVAGFAYTVTGVDCDSGAALEPPLIVETTRDLEDILLPGGHPGFENRPFDADSEHLFADAFQLLEPGCYDVVAQPIDADGLNSDDCAPASASGVEVLDGQTTEVMLVSQCVNEGRGGLDVIAALNHAPQLIDVAYSPSKFTCGNQTRICVTATDADSDPLRLTVQAEDGVEVQIGDAEVNEAGETVICADVRVPGPGEYALDFTVFDLMHDAEGTLVPIESLLDEGVTSHDSIVLPVHAMDGEACICDCPDGFALNAAGDACEAFIEEEAIFNGEGRAVCEGIRYEQYGGWGARFPDGTIVTNPFFGENFDNLNGRLNEVGIWDCAATEDEWLGFSTCIMVEEAGEYVLGAGADDEFRVFVDGNLVSDGDSDIPGANYRYWWMTPIQLSAGPHVIQMEGIDHGGEHAFGAEIYGPFAPGSTADTQSLLALDYENSIIWNTNERLGGTFDVGQNSGYSCPDGTSLNLCGEVPTCTGHQVVACGE